MRTLEGRFGRAGQSLAEYALLLSLIAIAAVSVLLVLGGNISTVLSTIADSL